MAISTDENYFDSSHLVALQVDHEKLDLFASVDVALWVEKETEGWKCGSNIWRKSR